MQGHLYLRVYVETLSKELMEPMLVYLKYDEAHILLSGNEQGFRELQECLRKCNELLPRVHKSIGTWFKNAQAEQPHINWPIFSKLAAFPYYLMRVLDAAQA